MIQPPAKPVSLNTKQSVTKLVWAVCADLSTWLYFTEKENETSLEFVVQLVFLHCWALSK